MNKLMKNILRALSAGLTIGGIITLFAGQGVGVAEIVGYITTFLGIGGLSTALGVEFAEDSARGKKRKSEDRDIRKSFGPIEKQNGLTEERQRETSAASVSFSKPLKQNLPKGSIYGGPEL